MGTKAHSLAHTKWLCKYHIVFTPKYRRKIIFAQLRESIKEILQCLCKYKGVEILEGHLMPDHVHMLVSIPPKISVANFMGYLKGKSSLMIFDKHANLKYKFGNRKFWAEGYYVSTVGRNEATIKKYIQDQERHDIMRDKLTSREYQDPFKGVCRQQGHWANSVESQRLQSAAGNEPLRGQGKPPALRSGSVTLQISFLPVGAAFLNKTRWKKGRVWGGEPPLALAEGVPLPS